MTIYRWHYDIPVINAFDQYRIASVLLPEMVDAPSEITMDNIETLFPGGYVATIYVSRVAGFPTVYVATPRGYRPCPTCKQALTACADDDCPECGGLGYVEVQAS